MKLYINLMFFFFLLLLFNGISTLFRLFNAKAILLEEQLWYYLTHSWEDKGVHTFPKSISLKVIVTYQGLIWFLCLMAYQLFLGYLMPKPFS